MTDEELHKLAASIAERLDEVHGFDFGLARASIEDLQAGQKAIADTLEATHHNIQDLRERYDLLDQRFDSVLQVLQAQGNAIARVDDKIDQLLDSKLRRVEGGRSNPEARAAKGGQ